MRHIGEIARFHPCPCRETAPRLGILLEKKANVEAGSGVYETYLVLDITLSRVACLDRDLYLMLFSFLTTDTNKNSLTSLLNNHGVVHRELDSVQVPYHTTRTCSLHKTSAKSCPVVKIAYSNLLSRYVIL